jgi:hypothetical protein
VSKAIVGLTELYVDLVLIETFGTGRMRITAETRDYWQGRLAKAIVQAIESEVEAARREILAAQEGRYPERSE